MTSERRRTDSFLLFADGSATETGLSLQQWADSCQPQRLLRLIKHPFAVETFIPGDGMKTRLCCRGVMSMFRSAEVLSTFSFQTTEDFQKDLD